MEFRNASEADAKKLEKLETLQQSLNALSRIMGPMASDLRQILDLLRKRDSEKG